MALGTGQLSLGDIAGEYGGSAPHALSEYYDKGNAPGSGEIQIHADFNGTANVFNFAISSNASQLNLRSAASSAGWDGSSPVHATINSGVVIYSGSTGSYAMVINGSWSGGVTLTNNGTILGKGGSGGNGAFSGHCNPKTQGCYCAGQTQSATSAGSGGPALQISSAVTIINANGRIAGGGGGGGGGSNYSSFASPGGGGGGGIGNGAAGSSYGNNGSAGSLTGAGSGGGSFQGNGCNSGDVSGAGGAGGSYGASGSAGGNAPGSSQSSGGSAGAATSGQSNVTWTSTGTRNGSVG